MLFFLVVFSPPPLLLSDSADNFCALAGEKSFFSEKNFLDFLELVGVGLDMELLNERELWQRSFSLSTS